MKMGSPSNSVGLRSKFIAAGIDTLTQLGQICKDAVRQRLPQEWPHTFRRLQLRRIRWLMDDMYPFRDLQLL